LKSTLVPGLRRVVRIEVDRARTIGFLGEEMRVYSTPFMVGDVEYSSLKFIEEHLDEGESSVGIRVAVDHLGPTPLGQWVEIHLEVTSVEGRKATIAAEIRDAIEVVGKAEHVRFVIDVKRHAERLKTKAAKYGTS
jgi:fluoroacetyl-CoA thioesterase